MKTELTIRNCEKMFRVICPKTWDELTPTDSIGVRHCSACQRDVFLCRTDEETIAHAKAGDCIAREVASESELPEMVLGRPHSFPVPTPEQEVASEFIRRERAIDDSITNADSDRSCPECGYPAPRWRQACRVCGFHFGRWPLE